MRGTLRPAAVADGDMFKFNPFSPDMVFTIGDLAEGMRRAFSSALRPQQQNQPARPQLAVDP